MPKVETSPNKRGAISTINSNVSNNIGKVYNPKINTQILLRKKRETDILSNQKRRRVVKKLIRLQPVLNNTKSYKVDTTTRRARRRLKIKKKKRRILTNIDNSDNDEHLQQATKPRRKIVITRKRLLPNPSKPSDFNETMEFYQVTKILPSSTLKSHFTNQASDYSEKEDEENNTEENLIESSEEAQTYSPSNSDDSTENENDYNTSSEEIEDIDDYDISTEDLVEKYDSTEDEIYTEDTTEIKNMSRENLIESVEDLSDEINDQPTFQDIPDYEPSFPELTESLDAPLLLLKTTVLSSIETLTKTITQSRLRTYTFVVTRVSGAEQIVTSTTEVKPQIKTSVLTESVTMFTTLTLLDFDTTQTLTEPQITITSTLDNSQSQLFNQDNAVKTFNEEARYNLATRIMSNGVEVIVAGDKTTLPGNPDIKRLAPSSVQKPVTLKPSTLTDHMVMILPQDASNIDNLSSSLYPDQFITKTCLTTFTYLTTYLEGSTTTVSSHEQVVSNIATEERNTGKILPTPAVGITLTQYPNLSVDVFHTTYTYLNTILDGEQPLVVSSEHTVTNTVTAPDDYLSLLKPSETQSALKDTNTYFSTINLEKTLYEGDKSSVISTKEIVTQVVITESVPPKATSVMTSYIALDMEDNPVSMSSFSITDVLKTYFVTYTYYNTVSENGKQVINTNVSTSSDIVTEKIYIQPKKSQNATPITKSDKKKHKLETAAENFQILATKSYFTTFTYFTTLLDDPEQSTVIHSRTSVVQNVVTETIDPSLLDKKYLNLIKNDIKDGSSTVVRVATLQNGQKVDITAVAKDNLDKIKPTKVLPIEKTQMPVTAIENEPSTSSPSIITGSTIIFVDDDPFAQLVATPSLMSKVEMTSTIAPNNLDLILDSKIVDNTKNTVSKPKKVNKGKPTSSSILIASTKSTVIQTTNTKTQANISNKLTLANDKLGKPAGLAPASDLLGLGSININSLQALTPVLNAMAGLITTNLKTNRRNDVNVTTTTPKSIVYQKVDKKVVPAVEVQNRSPIYIPVGGMADDFEIAESQNIATFDWVDGPPKDQIAAQSTQEASLLNGGIPISPGDIITANSDVIVGKPGRIGPRIPSIPLNRVQGNDEIPLGMKPPPVPNKLWPKKNHEYKHIPVGDLQAPNKDDYVGPPPPFHGLKDYRGDKRKHIPLSSPPRKDINSFYNEQYTQQQDVYAHTQTNYDPSYSINNIKQQADFNNLQESILKNYETAAKQSYPVYAQNHGSPPIIPGIPINDLNIKPSVINEPIVLPEIIERSTGQPLLVNIQPSQVAFVNMPYNRTTALIYGGSTEPHRNGQYFDDPSPYPEPEFSGIEYNKVVPSVYHNQHPNQKQVNGVIKVGSQLINVEPEVSANQKIPIKINPSKPQYIGNKQEININVPPISFGLMQQGNDFNAHVINHGGIEFRPPATPYEVINQPNIDVNIPNEVEYFVSTERSNGGPSNLPTETYPMRQDYHRNPQDTFIKPNNNKLKYSFPPKRNILRPKPTTPEGGLLKPLEYMTPPPVSRNTLPKGPYMKRPLPIPLTTVSVGGQPIPINKHFIPLPNNYPSFNKLKTQQQNAQSHSNSDDLDIGDHEEDDLPNEDGEVLQESNSRPLLPGEVPFEVLKAHKTSSTTQSNRIRFPTEENLNNNNKNFYRPALSENARPFTAKPTSHHTNSIVTASTEKVYENESPSRIKSSPNGIVVVGNQFENNQGSSNQIVVSGSQFTNVNRDVNKFGSQNNVTRIRNEFPYKTKNTVGTKRPVYRTTVSTTTQKPILIFIDEKGVQDKYFFDKKQKHKNNERPSVTSLPLDTHIAAQVPEHRDTQTEKPFIPQQNPPLSPNQIIISDEVITKPTIVDSSAIPGFNTGEIEVTYGNTSITEMEIMKPPPLVPNTTVKEPATDMVPPKVNTESPTFNSQVTTSKHRLEEMLPPPQTTKDEVLGMIPPPLVTTYKPPLPNLHKFIHKEIPFLRSSTTTTEFHKFTRPSRRPYTRRPGSTTTTPAISPITRRKKPSYHLYEATSRITTDVTTNKMITPSPTIKSKPSMEVIIGHPDLNVGENNEFIVQPIQHKQIVELTSSELPPRESTTEKTMTLNVDPSDLVAVESGIPTLSYDIKSQIHSKEDVTTQAVHHVGNEIKVFDETSRKVVPSLKESKTLLPTRYLTYTKTSTVTITKTTVVKSLGLPPSTMTLLVTKTEKTTLVDTVTEVHTLLKPTSIIETVTTTIHQGSSLYPPEVYGSPYPSIQIRPTATIPTIEAIATNIPDISGEDDLEDFIISETNPPVSEEKHDDPLSNDSILVVMTDKHTKNVVNVPNISHETQERDEMIANNEVNNILLGGILIANHPEEKLADRCVPDCKPARNELCQKVEGLMRCVCRPGFARMFPDRPCLPTYTYDLKINLERIGKDPLHFYDDLKYSNSSEYIKFSQAIREALDRMVMQSDLRDVFHGVEVHTFEPGPDTKGILSRFYLQLSDNIEEARLEDVFKKYLRNNSYSLGGTDIFAATTNDFQAQDFDECSHQKFHDCSENAHCFNLKGTYTCSCKEGFSDLSENMLYPGRVCSAEQIGCDRCSYHGTCYSRGRDEVFCECFQWYTGDSCHINLKVLLIALVTLGIILFVLLLICIILTCVKRKPRNAGIATGMGFLPQRVTNSGRGAMDRRAMIQDTSSEDSRSESNTLPYVQKQNKPKGALKKISKVSMQLNKEIEHGEATVTFPDQKDRSLTVMIPRAKYHPAPPTSPLINYTSFDARKPSVPSTSNEAKLLSYLDAGPSPNKVEASRKISNNPSETFMGEKHGSRKTSGALVSAGFEVSATVVNNMGTLGTTCGTEADRSENATLIQKISADLLSSTDTRSQFNTLRKSLIDDDRVTPTDWLDLVPRVMTVSDARSYDETTIPPPMKSFRTNYDSKLSSSQHQNDEANTMAERDLGSTFLLPHTHLYKPDRGSDISGFESL